MVTLGLTPDQIIGLLGALDRWLVRRMGTLAVPYHILVVGGAAIAMQWDHARMTNDVDVVSDGLASELREGVAAVAAKQRGVRTDWLNDAAKIGSLSPQVDPDPCLIYKGTNLMVYGASARYVMAMKLVVRRPIDLEDLPILLRKADFESLEEALEWVARAHSHRRPIPVAARYLLEGLWADLYER